MQADYLSLDIQPALFVRRQTCRGLQTNRSLIIDATISCSNRMQLGPVPRIGSADRSTLVDAMVLARLPTSSNLTR
jgi:hypothetical protein